MRKRLAALIACSLIATILPISAVAENGIPAGSGAVITAGQPMLVRVAPGWNAEVSYEIADGSYVTVWGAEQVAPDGTLWYPVDGGFVPADGVTSVATYEGGLALYQEAAPAATTEEWVDPAATEGWVDPNTGQWVEAQPATEEWVEPAVEGWVDPNTGQWVEAVPGKTEEWVDPAASEGWVDPNTGLWVEPAATEGWVDPNTGQWVEPSTSEGWVDPNTGQWVAAAPVATAPAEGWVDPNTGQWIEPNVSQGWIDPNTGQWVEPAPAAAPTEGWVDPNTGQWVEPTVSEGWFDPNTGQWVESVPVQQPAEEWTAPAPADTGWSGGPEGWGEPIATAYISGTSGGGAACRAAPERGTEKLAILSEGEAVEVRGEAVGEWQPVNCAGVGGYVNTSLISWEPLVTDDGGGRNRGGGGGGGGGSATGQQVASFAQQYIGYPYAYAGEGPYAFDCSGFAKFVIQNTLGIDITHDMFTQIGMGQSVGMGELQPGDLVFFQNTFRPGLSHVGIYIGGGQFVHAENEGTGVKVSDLNSDYYGSRWAGGTRLA
jgi:hypothetical protein